MPSKRGYLQETLVIFTGDNGTNSVLTSEFKGEQIRGGKGYTHDYGMHVPLIANWPGRIPGGRINQDLVCCSDFFPTMVEAAGLKPKEITDGDGWSFWPQCRGEKGVKREWIYGYCLPRSYAKKFDDMYDHWEVRYARDRRHRLYDNGNLYDTMDDVVEKRVIAPDDGDEQARRAREKFRLVFDSCPNSGLGVSYGKVKGTLRAPAKRETRN